MDLGCTWRNLKETEKQGWLHGVKLERALSISEPAFAFQENVHLQKKDSVPQPILVVTPSPFSSTQKHIKLPEEPDEFDEQEVEANYDWQNDMFFLKFDMTGKSDVDNMTARRTYKLWRDDFGTPVVIMFADPLFYWIDLNANGKFEQNKGEMGADPYEDGLTGNEKPYFI